ncbi:TolC family protein [Serratia sp. IR-2025]
MIFFGGYFRKGAIAIPALILLSGCVGSNRPDLTQKVPDKWDVAMPAWGHLVDLRSWWQTFNDPVLDELVENALANNLNIAQAEQWLKTAQALNGATASSYLPHLRAGVQPVQDAAARDNYLHGSIDMVWELSLYGESANRQQAGEAVVLSAQAREQGVRISVVANVVQNYLRFIYAGRQLSLLSSQEAVEKRLHTLAAIRKTAHIGDAEEQISSSLRMARLQANIIELQQVREQSSRALALLTNKTLTQTVQILHYKINLTPDIRIKEIPADLLRTRPDIRQAEADVLQSAADVGLAQAALYPRLTLSGSLLYAYNQTENYRRSGSNSIPALGPIIDIPLWDWGMRLANKHAKEHELQAALLGYRKAVQDGVGETEDALSSLNYQNQCLQALHTAFEQQNHLRIMQQKLNQLGLSSEYDGLSGKSTMLQVESELVEAEFKHASAFVTLFKALGGAPLSAVSESFTTHAEGR